MPTVFQISQKDDSYHFDLINENGDYLLIGGDFDTKENAESAIQEVRVGSLMSQQIAASKISNGDMFFVIKNSAGQIIAKSQLFNNQMKFDSTLHQVKDNACIAEIVG